MPETMLPTRYEIGTHEGRDEDDGGESGAPATPQHFRFGRVSEDAEKKSSNKKLKGLEICVPIVYGTISFWLGRKVSESESHKWTVYVRGAANEDLNVVIRKVVFKLHPSFNNPIRVVESPPFELSERGWGEFDIAIAVFFHADVCDRQLDLFHHLKLYSEADTGPPTTKKPVVVETYDEIVFPDPYEDFFARVQNHPSVIVPRLPASFNLSTAAPIEEVHEKKGGDTKNHPLSQWFVKFSEANELLRLASARQQVQGHIVKMRRQLSMMEGLPSSLEPIYGQHVS